MMKPATRDTINGTVRTTGRLERRRRRTGTRYLPLLGALSALADRLILGPNLRRSKLAECDGSAVVLSDGDSQSSPARKQRPLAGLGRGSRGAILSGSHSQRRFGGLSRFHLSTMRRIARPILPI